MCGGARHIFNIGPETIVEVDVKKVVTWIVVADHQHARFFENDGPTRGIQPIEGLSLDTHLAASHDLMSDRPGRGVSAKDGIRHGFQPHVDAHRQEGVKFVQRVVEVVTKASEKGEFDRLILVMPPRALGEVRKSLPELVRAKITGELAADLTKSAASEIASRLGALLPA